MESVYIVMPAYNEESNIGGGDSGMVSIIERKVREFSPCCCRQRKPG